MAAPVSLILMINKRTADAHGLNPASISFLTAAAIPPLTWGGCGYGRGEVPLWLATGTPAPPAPSLELRRAFTARGETKGEKGLRSRYAHRSPTASGEVRAKKDPD